MTFFRHAFRGALCLNLWPFAASPTFIVGLTDRSLPTAKASAPAQLSPIGPISKAAVSWDACHAVGVFCASCPLPFLARALCHEGIDGLATLLQFAYGSTAQGPRLLVHFEAAGAYSKCAMSHWCTAFVVCTERCSTLLWSVRLQSISITTDGSQALAF